MEKNKIYNADALQGLKMLSTESINTCVTSPPYWNLRDYGVAGQIGLEDTLEEYIEKIVLIFREVKRVLRKDGTLWLNLGDTYVGTGGDRLKPVKNKIFQEQQKNNPKTGRYEKKKKLLNFGLKPKDIIGIPWRIAFALQADGWYLRQDIIWNKPNCMPESVKDRCTKSHEYIFLLSKSPKYYYDYKSILEPLATSTSTDRRLTECNFTDKRPNRDYPGNQSKASGLLKPSETEMRNKRTVWTVTTKSFKEAHFATFPPDLIEPCIKAGSPKNGIVLDPFMGSGTVAKKSLELGRNYLGIELNPDYIKIADRRLQEIQLKII